MDLSKRRKKQIFGKESDCTFRIKTALGFFAGMSSPYPCYAANLKVFS